MPQTIYIDVLFFVNFIMDGMIFLSAATLCRQKVRMWRVLASAVVGALCSCAVFFADAPPVLLNLCSAVLYILCTLLIFGYGDAKKFLKRCAATGICVCVFGGVALALSLTTDAGAVMTFSNGAVYIDIPVFLLLLFSFAAYGAIWLIGRLTRWLAPKERFARVTLRFGDISRSGRALIDTGSALRDAVTGSPVVLCAYRFVAGALPPGLRAYLRDTGTDVDLIEEEWRGRLRMVGYSSVGGGGILPALRADCVQIEYCGRSIEQRPGLVAITSADLSGQGECDMLLTPQHVA